VFMVASGGRRILSGMSRFVLAFAVALVPCCVLAQDAHVLTPSVAPYKVLKTVKVGGEGGFDYVTADSDARRLYVARSGPAGSLHVYDLDSLAQVGEIPSLSAHGAVVDDKYQHGFATSKPVAMFDAKTLKVEKTLEVQGNPDGYLADEAEHRVYILSHSAPNVTVLDAKDGAVLGTVDIGGAPEQGALDGHGHLFVDVEDKGAIAVIDTKTMKLTGTYDLVAQGGGAGCAGLAYDAKFNLLFAACRDKKSMVVVNAATGHVVTMLPNGVGTDSVAYNEKTGEVFSSQGDGTLTIYKAKSATEVMQVQTVATPVRAKTLTLDKKTGHVLLITAEFGPAPAGMDANGRPQRPPMVPGTFEIVVVGQ
jgi:DNA-binding beta-propeller fold protein YncE